MFEFFWLVVILTAFLAALLTMRAIVYIVQGLYFLLTRSRK